MRDRARRQALDELAADAATGARAVMLFVIQIGSADRFALARDIDPAYGTAFDRARAEGVEMLAWRCKVDLDGIEMAAPVPIVGRAEAQSPPARRIACVARPHAYIAGQPAACGRFHRG